MRLVNLRRSGLFGPAIGLCLLGLSGCVGPQKPSDTPLDTELELAYDEGPPTERPLLPPAAYEWLIKFEPNLPAYRPLRLRLLLAQPGPLRFVLYSADAEGRPSTPLRTIERNYAPELTSGGQDGKWLRESLADLPLQTGPLFVGISAPTPGSDAARLWAAEKSGPAASSHVFQRDAEPGTALQSSRLPLVPIVRLALIPAAPPPAPAPTPAAAPAAPAPAAAAPAAPATVPAPAPAPAPVPEAPAPTTMPGTSP